MKRTPLLRRTLSVLREISDLGKQLRTLLSAGKGPDPTETDIPRDFIRAWYHALLCMLYWSPLNMEAAFKQSQSCRRFLLSARRKLLKVPGGSSLRDLEVVLPTGILVFMAHSLLKDVTQQYPQTRAACWEYYAGLVREILSMFHQLSYLKI